MSSDVKSQSTIVRSRLSASRDRNFFGMEVGKSFDLALPICAVSLVRGNDRLLSGTMWWLTITGRLKPGWSIDQATSQMQSISPGVFEAALPANYPPASVKDFLASRLIAVPAGAGVSELREEYEQSLWLLLAIAGQFCWLRVPTWRICC